MKRTFKIFLLAVIVLGSFVSFGQSFTPDSMVHRKKIITIVPQYAIINGLKFGVDIPLKQKYRYLEVSPTIYLDPSGGGSMWNDDYETMWGVSLDIHHRVFISKTKKGLPGFYFSYGGVVQYYNYQKTDYVPYEYQTGGSTYTTYENKTYNDEQKRYGLDFTLGYTIFISKVFVLDLYGGVGMRLCLDSQNQMVKTSNGWFDHSYSGVLFQNGLRIGFAL